MHTQVEERRAIAYRLHQIARATTKAAQKVKAVDVLARHMDRVDEKALLAGVLGDLRDLSKWAKWCEEHLEWLESDGRWNDDVKPPEKPGRKMWQLM